MMETKLLILFGLASMTGMLGGGVLTLQWYVNQEKLIQQKRQSATAGTAGSTASSRPIDNTTPWYFRYIFSRSDDPRLVRSVVNMRDLVAPDGASSQVLIGNAYWNQARSFLQWDAVVGQRPDAEDEEGDAYANRHDPIFVPSIEQYLVHSEDEGNARVSTRAQSSSSSSTAGYPSSIGKTKLAADPAMLLIKAADAGHPTAQHYAAMAYASGIWPVSTAPYDSPNGSAGVISMAPKLQVAEEFIDVSAGVAPAASVHNDENRGSATKREPVSQIIQSYLYWHLAAMGGNIEAAMALAHRIDVVHPDFEPNDGGGSSQTSGQAGSTSSCERSLPYYEAAGNGIMDQLEHAPNSRGRVLPPQDHHSLAEIYMHGGQSSQLDWHNKPSESKDALQFYHIRATMGVDATAYAYGGAGSAVAAAMKSKTSSATAGAASLTAAQPDIDAAHTLAQFYHGGVRGAPQNLTKALFYYEISSEFGDRWDAHGHLGMFYFWGLGMDRPYRYTAWEYFDMGAPLGLEGCRRRHDKSLRLSRQQKQQQNNGAADDDDSEDDPLVDDSRNKRVVTCDPRAVNGLGLVHLHGIPGELKPDLQLAEKYFTLAKEMGSIDAGYNLAMMWLGWKTHYKSVDDLSSDGKSSAEGVEHPFQQEPQQAAAAKGKTGGDGDDDDDDDDDDDVYDTFALHKSRVPGKQVYKGSTQKDYTDAIRLLTAAAGEDHIMAHHRLAMIYANGIKVRGNDGVIEFDVIKPDCQRARKHYKWITERASLDRSFRLRNAYKHYSNGNMEASLRNYLAAAETGSATAKSNAAFLLESGHCLGLSPHDCAKASVRLWKAAATLGNAEACLRVGDYYYYGRMRTNADGKEDSFGYHRIIGPFGWLQYIIFPEVYLPKLIASIDEPLKRFVRKLVGMASSSSSSSSSGMQNGEQRNDATAVDTESADSEEVTLNDLAMAAHYYTLAAEKHSSPRANFNLGFMHQWGLGLAHDFPLAKRHYDLAGNGANDGALLAIQIALSALSVHEKFLKMEMALIDWLDQKLEATLDSSSPWKYADEFQRQDFDADRRPTQVIVSHLLQWDSLIIAMLVYALLKINGMRRRKMQQSP